MDQTIQQIDIDGYGSQAIFLMVMVGYGLSLLSIDTDVGIWIAQCVSIPIFIVLTTEHNVVQHSNTMLHNIVGGAAQCDMARQQSHSPTHHDAIALRG